MKKKIIILIVLVLLIGSIPSYAEGSVLSYAEGSILITEGEAKDLAVEFSKNSVSDFSDGSADLLIDPEAEDLINFLHDKRIIKKVKEDSLGRKLSLIEFNVKDIKTDDINGKYQVVLTISVDFIDGDEESSLTYFSKVIIDKITGLIIAASTNDLSAGTLLKNQVISSGDDLLKEWGYNLNSVSERNYSLRSNYNLEDVIQEFEDYVHEIRKEDVATDYERMIKSTPIQNRASYSSFSSSQRQDMRVYQDNWFNGFNPNYANFTQDKGDCTNYASQILYAGCGVMYPSSNSGISGPSYWFYRSANDRSSSWTGVDEIRTFLLNNTTKGPSGSISSTYGALEPGDIITLGTDDEYYHSVIVYNQGGDPYVTAHSTSYSGYFASRYGGAPNSKIHIGGYY